MIDELTMLERMLTNRLLKAFQSQEKRISELEARLQVLEKERVVMMPALHFLNTLIEAQASSQD